MRGTAVRFNGSESAHLAVLTKFNAPSRRSMLSVFSPQGQLIYQELLDRSRGICAARDSDGDGEVLLVGNGPAVYSYRLR